MENFRFMIFIISKIFFHFLQESESGTYLSSQVFHVPFWKINYYSFDNRRWKKYEYDTKRIRVDYTTLSEYDKLNFCIKMETGTGKTYVYTKTIFEVNRKFKSFISAWIFCNTLGSVYELYIKEK